MREIVDMAILRVKVEEVVASFDDFSNYFDHVGFQSRYVKLKNEFDCLFYFISRFYFPILFPNFISHFIHFHFPFHVREKQAPSHFES